MSARRHRRHQAGDKVSFEIEAFPNRAFTGEVTRIDRSPEASKTPRAIASSSARQRRFVAQARHARDDPDRDHKPDQAPSGATP